MLEKNSECISRELIILAEIKKEVSFVIRVSEHLLNLARAHAKQNFGRPTDFLKLFIDYSSLCSSEDSLIINEYNKIIPRITLILLAKAYLINYDFNTAGCMQIPISFFFSRIMQNFSMRQISKCEYCYELAKFQSRLAHIRCVQCVQCHFFFQKYLQTTFGIPIPYVS